jgi:HAD superfamily hydrolase (TIGR01493 family)
MGSDELLDHLLGSDRDTTDDEQITTSRLALYRQFWGRLTPLPGATALLGECSRRGHRTVLASSASGDELAALRAALDADDVIDTATSSSDADAGKPDPSVLEAALDQAALSADRVVFVGDAVWDGIAAKQVGVPFVAVTCGGTSASDLREAGAIEVWRDPADLLDAIDDSVVGRLGAFEKTRTG